MLLTEIRYVIPKYFPETLSNANRVYIKKF